MHEQAHEGILNRQESREHVQQHLTAEIAFLTDLVNYGTNLIIRTLGHGSDDIAKQVVCGGLLKHVVGMMDACVVLLENGHSTTAFLQARSAFEASLYVELILKKQPAHRARTYLVGEYRRQRTFALDVLDESDVPGSFNARFASIGMNTANLDSQAKVLARKQIADVNKHLEAPPFDQIEKTYQTKRGKSKNDPSWYRCLGFESLFQVAKDMGQIPAYELWYQHGSSIVHADSFSQQVLVQEGKCILKPIRNLEEAHQICGAVGQIGLRTYRIVLEHYRPLELDPFRAKYIEDWRTTFRSSKKITYLFQ